MSKILRAETAGGATLIFGLTVALIWANVAHHSYLHLLHHPLPALFHHWAIGTPQEVVVNGLMTIFFFAIGLELSREFRVGQLQDTRAAIAPVLSALGGMAATALLLSVLGWLFQNGTARSAWGVPMATDVAFALGVLALAGPRIPRELRIFLLTLAVADDIFSVVALAMTGPHAPHATWVLAALGLAILAAIMAKRLVSVAWIALLIVEWILFTKAGVEPSLAGVLVGLAVPFSAQHSTGHVLEGPVMMASTWIALPLFAFVATGVAWSEIAWDRQSTLFGLFLFVARIAGKVIGIVGVVALTRRAGVGPEASLTTSMFVGLALLCAVGFTVPLLFASNVLGPNSTLYLMATLSLLVASLVSAVAGVCLLRSRSA